VNGLVAGEHGQCVETDAILPARIHHLQGRIPRKGKWNGDARITRIERRKGNGLCLPFQKYTPMKYTPEGDRKQPYKNIR